MDWRKERCQNARPEPKPQAVFLRNRKILGGEDDA